MKTQDQSAWVALFSKIQDFGSVVRLLGVDGCVKSSRRAHSRRDDVVGEPKSLLAACGQRYASPTTDSVPVQVYLFLSTFRAPHLTSNASSRSLGRESGSLLRLSTISYFQNASTAEWEPNLSQRSTSRRLPQARKTVSIVLIRSWLAAPSPDGELATRKTPSSPTMVMNMEKESAFQQALPDCPLLSSTV